MTERPDFDQVVFAAGELHSKLEAVSVEAEQWPEQSQRVRADLVAAGDACRDLLKRIEPAVAWLEHPPNDG